MIIEQLLLFGLTVTLCVSLPLSVIAALGFRDSPFGHVTMPLPFILTAYLLSDGVRVAVEQPPTLYYVVLTTIAIVGVVYVAANAFLLLTERREV